MKTDDGNVSNEDGISERNDIGKAVKGVLQKRDQGVCNTLNGLGVKIENGRSML